MDPKFGGIIWTNHALDRLRERGISQSDAWATWSRPDQSRYATAKGAWVYYKTYGNDKLEVVAKKNEKGEWIVLSVWSRPVLEKHSAHPDRSVTKEKSFLRKIFEILFVKKENWK